MGNAPFPAELKKTKLRFGALDEDEDEGTVYVGAGERVGHCAFGTISQTHPVVKGRSYAGLKVFREHNDSVDKEKQPLMHHDIRDK